MYLGPDYCDMWLEAGDTNLYLVCVYPMVRIKILHPAYKPYCRLEDW